jgi:hypothetical protein
MKKFNGLFSVFLFFFSVANNVVLAEGRVKFDPMERPAVVKPFYAHQIPALSMIICPVAKGESCRALIGGKWLGVGQEFDGYRVNSVGKSDVTLIDARGPGKIKLYLSRDVKHYQ